MNTPDSPTILIVNIHSALNAGDLALLQATMQQMQAAFERPRFILLANWPDEAPLRELDAEILPSPWRLAGLHTDLRPRWQVLRWLRGLAGAHLAASLTPQTLSAAPQEWRPVLNAYQRADLVLAVPGNQFFSSGRWGWPLPVLAMAVDLAGMFKKPLYIMPQSIGPFRYAWERGLLRRSYARARRVFLRDAGSLELAHKLGIPAERAVFAPDPAFAYPALPPEEGLEILKRWGYQPGQPALGVTVIARMPGYLDSTRMDFYYRSLAQVLGEFSRRHAAQVVFFNQVSGPTFHEDDRLGSKIVFDLLGGEGNPHLHRVDEALAPDQLKACYGWMDLFVASRLHSGIFAMGLHVPTVFVGYLTKTRGLLRSLGLEDWVLDLNQLSEAGLDEKLEQAWVEREQRRERLLEIIPPTAQAALEVGHWIGADFRRHFGR